MKRKKLIEYKMKYLMGATFLILLVLLARVSYMQLVQTEQYRTLARNNYIRIAPVFAPRGEIFDRNGEKIVTNRPIYTVSINDLSLEGTTHHLYLDRIGPDTVQMAETLAWILAGDEESVQYFQQISGMTPEQFEKEVSRDDDEDSYRAKKEAIEEIIKERVSSNKVQLEKGEPLEIAVVYNPSTVATLQKRNLASFGVRLEKKTDVLSELVTMLHREGVFEDKTVYQVESDVRATIREKKYYRPYEPVLVAENIPPQTVVTLRERQIEMPGVVVDIQPVRDYPYQSLLAHALGYVQNIKREQYEEHKDEGYFMNDLYGQNGLELVYESYLRGEHGARQMEVDANSRPVRDLGLKEPVPGNDLVLTIDLNLQMAAEKALADGVKRAQDAGYSRSKAGAAVVMDVRTGAVRAMASYPSYNPGIFTGGLTSTQWQQLQDSGALLNRTISAIYPPGSTFKMVTAAAILEHEIVDPDHKMHDPGYYRLGQGIFRDWKPGGHGMVDIRKALEVSCDTYFYNYGRMAGVDAISNMAKEFGLGEKTGINLPGELSGVVPTPQWKYELVKNMLIMYNNDFARVRELNQQIEHEKNATRKEQLQKARDEELEKQLAKHEWDLNWQQYETVNMSIGQGDNTYTIMQLAAYVAAIANNGTLYKPYLVEKIVNPDGRVIKQFQPEVKRRVNVSPKTLQILREGMHMVALPPNGTASAMFGLDVAAKTGTAEVLDANGKKIGNHALFVAFAPYENPEVAVAVILEYGHAGGTYAGPIARGILDAYLTGPAAGATEETRGQGQEREQAPDYTPGSMDILGYQPAGIGDLPEGWDALPALNWPGWEQPSGGGAAVQGEMQENEGNDRVQQTTTTTAPARQEPTAPTQPVQTTSPPATPASPPAGNNTPEQPPEETEPPPVEPPPAQTQPPEGEAQPPPVETPPAEGPGEQSQASPGTTTQDPP
ncbi:penicillin-binding protein 2 [Desulfallas thermosapovorans]|uniref:Penicillin-binding protein 2 n=1 Tax=Desulfallas thermosapovorans DSM 6562 TaxID=1121431 RepID=A0A5S4ZY90_9FIRM|nr:penicillin-binding protein 2 [Desulfallas thermosapovorans]TYO98033.1 penicillin-binding protein 2 [Desulfallas thermosapovorans DSM 6562]